MNFLKYSKKGYNSFKQGGLQKLYSDIRRFLGNVENKNVVLNATQSLLKKKPASHLSFITDHPITKPLIEPQGDFNTKKMILHWVIPDFDPGAGGHMTIFRTIHFLESFGHENTIWITYGSKHGSEEKAHQVIKDFFIDIKGPVKFLHQTNLDSVKGDAVFATDRWTAYPVRGIQNVRKRFYFVQDFEPSFYPMGGEFLLTENTYHFGFSCITAGKWLEKIMKEKYQLEAYSFELSVDRNVYFQNEKKQENKIVKIAFYAREVTPRRAVDLGYLALELLSRKISNFHVDFFGWDLGALDVPYNYTNHGVVSHQQLCELYNQCDIGIVFSATNYSLIPQEMMACGLPVIDLDLENTRAVFPDDVLSFAKPDPYFITEEILKLINDSELRKSRIESGLNFINEYNWEKSAKKVEAALTKSLTK